MQMHKGLYKDDLYSVLVDYWIECWKTAVHGVENGNLGIKIINIRILAQDLINDYEQNEFQSKANSTVYISLINRLLKEVELKNFRIDLTLLKESLEHQDYQSVYVISKEIVSKFGELNLSIDYISSIIDILTTKNNVLENRRQIDSFTEKLIIDLIVQGYRVDDLKNLLYDCFDGYIEKDAEPLITAYTILPEEILELKDKNELTEKAKIYIDSLTIIDRLNIFKGRLSGKHIEKWFVFPIWGVNHQWGEELYMLGGYLYSPEMSPISETDRTIDEFFYNYPPNEIDGGDEEKRRSVVEDLFNKSAVNLKVFVKSVSFYSGYEQAQAILRDVLNFLNIHFGSEYNEIFWDKQYRAIDKNKIGFTGTMFPFGEEKEFSRKRNISRTNPLNLHNEELSEIGRKLSFLNDTNGDKSIEKNTIKNVAQLFNDTRGKTERDKILNYWIILESLSNILKMDKLSTFDFLKKIVTNMYVLDERYKPLHVLYSKIEFYTRFAVFNKNKLTGISQDLLHKLGIDPNRERHESVSLLPLYKMLIELSNTIKDEDLKQLVDNTIKFYSDNDYALNIINEKEENVQLTVCYIYKTRNQLVHNGFVNQNIAPHLVNYAEGFAFSLFNRIIDVCNGDKIVDLKLHFLEEDFEARYLKYALRNDKTYKILDERSFYNTTG